MRKIKYKSRDVHPDIVGMFPDEWPEFVKSILMARSIENYEQVDLKLNQILSIGSFHEVITATQKILDYFDKKIVIYGDYDADGVTSTSLFILSLKAMGFKQVEYFIPDRFSQGYGLSKLGIDEVRIAHDPDLIITVDNGITAHEAVLYAKKQGIETIIIDHHLSADTLPDALAIVNPNSKYSSFKGKDLAAVGVSFYLLANLSLELGYKDIPKKFIDIVALGTMADLVNLDFTNRTLIKYGLKLLSQRKGRPGIMMLAERMGIDLENIDEEDLSYKIAPKINAAGRLNQIQLGIDCLIEQDPKKLSNICDQLMSVNSKRQALQAEMQSQAFDIASRSVGEDAKIIVLQSDQWHEGIIGLIASKIKEKYLLPTFIFSGGNHLIKGSGRSIQGFHLRDFLQEVSKQDKNLMKNFGGHAMAAGLTIERNSLDDLKVSMLKVIDQWNLHIDPVIHHDGILTDDDLTIENLELINQLGPWGKGFEYPRFYQSFYIESFSWVKDKHLKMTLRMADAKKIFSAIFFNAKGVNISQDNLYNIDYSPKINEFNGQRNIQLNIFNLNEYGNYKS